jgi:hypothetical protein
MRNVKKINLKDIFPFVAAVKRGSRSVSPEDFLKKAGVRSINENVIVEETGTVSLPGLL